MVSISHFPFISELEVTNRTAAASPLPVDYFCAGPLIFPALTLLLQMVPCKNGILLSYQRKAVSFSTSESIQCKTEPA